MKELWKTIDEAIDAGLTEQALISTIRRLTDEYKEENAIIICSLCESKWTRSQLLRGEICLVCGGTHFYTETKL